MLSFIDWLEIVIIDFTSESDLWVVFHSIRWETDSLLQVGRLEKTRVSYLIVISRSFGNKLIAF